MGVEEFIFLHKDSIFLCEIRYARSVLNVVYAESFNATLESVNHVTDHTFGIFSADRPSVLRIFRSLKCQSLQVTELKTLSSLLSFPARCEPRCL